MTAPKLVVVDYGMGNLRSAAKALEAAGARVTVSQSPRAFAGADGVVLPGVGAFGEAVRRLEIMRLFVPVRDWVRGGRPFLGICLGFQLLFDESSEFGLHRGLGCFPGRVVPFPRRLRVPHMGWNRLQSAKRGWLLRGLPASPWMYFVHSYYPRLRPHDASLAAARTEYGVRFVSAIERGAVAGVQFHPEKSQRDGLHLLRNFVAAVKRGGNPG